MRCSWFLGISIVAGSALAHGDPADRDKCAATLHDDASDKCIGVSSVPKRGMLFPLSDEFFFDSSGKLQVQGSVEFGGSGTFGFSVSASNGSFNGISTNQLFVADGISTDRILTDRIGIGILSPAAEVHILRSGSAEIILAADIDDVGEFDHPKIRFSQDGGGVSSFIGYERGTNSLTMSASNDSDMVFHLPLNGLADWEFRKFGGLPVDPKGRLDQDGDWHIDGGFFTGGADVAEYYPVRGRVEPGDVVVFRDGAELELAVSGNGAPLAGIVSSAPGVVLGLSYTREEEGGIEPELRIGEKRFLRTSGGHNLDRTVSHEIHVNRRAPLALTGRVPCKVSAENGAIEAGDLLAVSSIPGHAGKATESGPVIGTALESWHQGEGTILVLANLGWFSPSKDFERRLADLEDQVRALQAMR